MWITNGEGTFIICLSDLHRLTIVSRVEFTVAQQPYYHNDGRSVGRLMIVESPFQMLTVILENKKERKKKRIERKRDRRAPRWHGWFYFFFLPYIFNTHTHHLFTNQMIIGSTPIYLLTTIGCVCGR